MSNLIDQLENELALQELTILDLNQQLTKETKRANVAVENLSLNNEYYSDQMFTLKAEIALLKQQIKNKAYN